MISIIICSRSKNISSELSKNIQSTIGVPYEVICIDNSTNTYTIFEAYNEGITKSTYDFLCFIHDDIKVLSHDWGLTVVNYFESDDKIGVIGVAGSSMKSKAPSTWWINGSESDYPINIIERLPNKEPIHDKSEWHEGERLKEVVVIDGVFMAIRKKSSIKFNTLIPGFHTYDLNICLEYILSGYKIYVTGEILIEHFSAGKIDANWALPTHAFHKLYEKHLPLSVNKPVAKKVEVDNYVNFIIFCFDHGLKEIALYYWRKFVVFKPVSKYHLIFFKRLFE